MKCIDSFFQWLRKSLTGENKMVFIAAGAVILGVSQFVYLKYFMYPSSSSINETIFKLGAPDNPSTEETQQQLRELGPCVIDEIALFCEEVENPVQIQRALQRASAVEVLSSFYKNPKAVNTLIMLTESEDGIVRKKAIHDLRYQWGEGVIEALVKAIQTGDTALNVIQDKQPVPCIDFDIAAVESLIAMYKLWMGKDLKIAEKIQISLEKAFEYPRVAEKARKALGR